MIQKILLKCQELNLLNNFNLGIKVYATIALAYLLDDNELKKDLATDSSLFEFLLQILDNAINASDRRCNGFSVEELLNALARIAKNDDNKVKLMNARAAESGTDILKILNNVLSSRSVPEQISAVSRSVPEQISAVNAIWELAFNKENGRKIKVYFCASSVF